VEVFSTMLSSFPHFFFKQTSTHNQGWWPGTSQAPSTLIFYSECFNPTYTKTRALLTSKGANHPTFSLVNIFSCRNLPRQIQQHQNLLFHFFNFYIHNKRKSCEICILIFAFTKQMPCCEGVLISWISQLYHGICLAPTG